MIDGISSNRKSSCGEKSWDNSSLQILMILHKQVDMEQSTSYLHLNAVNALIQCF
jgi:hypothetical protein